MANELANVQTTDDPRRIERARKLAGVIVNPDARTRLLMLQSTHSPRCEPVIWRSPEPCCEKSKRKI